MWTEVSIAIIATRKTSTLAAKKLRNNIIKTIRWEEDSGVPVSKNLVWYLKEESYWNYKSRHHFWHHFQRSYSWDYL